MRIIVNVRASSGRQEIKRIGDSEYKVYLKETAEDGKANLELLKLLKEYFGKNVRIIKGVRSRGKIVEIK